jgi:hypothetical protein
MSVRRSNPKLLSHVCKALCLWLLLITAQQGAVVHELSHVPNADGVSSRVGAGGAADTACAPCPAFAQTVTPAFSHAFHVPVLVRANVARSEEPRFRAQGTAVPTPRSRGPPSFS